MKNTLLCCLAAVSLALSFFFDYVPNGKAASVAGGPAPIAEASFFSFPEGDNPASFRDSLNVGYYSQALGIKASYDDNASLLRTITEWLGTPYRFGSNSKSGTDCSGFVTRVFKEVYGISLVHSSRSMFNHVKRVSKDEMQTGDLVFFRRGPGQPIYHVGIYLKDGKFAHSATNGGVMVSSLQQPYYQRNFYAAGRVNRN
ncbi:NlpC/P60 family protein [Hymenobacter oligotrophus]|uniref:NlpC/P60 family protein n=1 Tax=Hymenobacter oligotrophus TaxID=2319843 RepID=A0A3B7RV55_9BACT|nr:NlpC/P60 family protein [Hymenobacter oligotrophus]